MLTARCRVRCFCAHEKWGGREAAPRPEGDGIYMNRGVGGSVRDGDGGGQRGELVDAGAGGPVLGLAGAAAGWVCAACTVSGLRGDRIPGRRTARE